MSSNSHTGLRFALAGHVVSDWRHAHRIWRDALTNASHSHIVPQARNVMLKLRRAAEAKVTGGER